jgi:hypothetical protein
MDYSKENTPIFSMSDYYNVLEPYLHNAHIDRQIPVDFKESVIVEGSNVILETIYPEFQGYDYVEVYINCHEINIDVSKVNLSFSPLLNGNAPHLTLKPNENTISVNDDDILSFEIDGNYTATDKSQKLTGIESIKIDFQDDATGVEILKLIIKSEDYTYTLTDINNACFSGHDYVLRSLNDMAKEKQGIQTIPDLLQRYVYMAAGAYAWLTRWENEAKAMKEPKAESDNYADRLFKQVDSAIERYLSNIENNRHEEYIRMDLFKKAKSRW